MKSYAVTVFLCLSTFVVCAKPVYEEPVYEDIVIATPLDVQPVIIEFDYVSGEELRIEHNLISNNSELQTPSSQPKASQIYTGKPTTVEGGPRHFARGMRLNNTDE
ncbi:hypothetical protein [Vibrio maerlii]|uniref:hypothetical protein n=1 Tax=Vibrio maerlii TaxID=2231648 RepID=UPI000E3EAC8B|nr:hypothetical protein [Vibrio maerlii]